MSNSNATPSSYRVLARKYRPESFEGLIGQETMVKTLTNAIRVGRLAHAFVLTGVRGVGKTTTARILARALNCIGNDGKGEVTETPCGQCENCQAITEGNHVDVLEMDAASRTGVENIRELLDGVPYRPVMARTKVYIIDEVHMLSTQAFNALLKTLEEPPPHVTFIFATTETRKVPVTVLSRCQRFDLRRVNAEQLTEHLMVIAKRESVKVEESALQLIARAADGSVRDGLSLLDQAIAFGQEEVTAEAVREMLGLVERLRVFDLFDMVIAGDIASALGELDQAYAAGADPLVLLQDLLELTHWLTRIKITPKTAESFGVPEEERTRGTAMAMKLTLPQLARVWQMLLKGVEEVRLASSPIQAAEMILIRLAYASDLPDPAALVKTLIEKEAGLEVTGHNPSLSGMQIREREEAPTLNVAPTTDMGGLATNLATEPEPPSSAVTTQPMPMSFLDAVQLFQDRREPLLHAHLVNNVHLVHFEPGRIEFNAGAHAPTNLANRLGELLSEWTGERWILSVSSDPGAPTLHEQAEARKQHKREEAAKYPLVLAVKTAFPKATIEAINPVGGDDYTPAPSLEENEGDPA